MTSQDADHNALLADGEQHKQISTPSSPCPVCLCAGWKMANGCAIGPRTCLYVDLPPSLASLCKRLHRSEPLSPSCGAVMTRRCRRFTRSSSLGSRRPGCTRGILYGKHSLRTLCCLHSLCCKRRVGKHVNDCFEKGAGAPNAVLPMVREGVLQTRWLYGSMSFVACNLPWHCL